MTAGRPLAEAFPGSLKAGAGAPAPANSPHLACTAQPMRGRLAVTKQKGHAGQSVGKGSRTAWPHLQYVDRDVDGLTFSPNGLLVDVLVRTGAGTAFLLEPVYGAYFRSMHNRKMLHQFVEEDGAGVPRDLEKLLFADTVFAFAGSRALPDLKEAVRRTL